MRECIESYYIIEMGKMFLANSSPMTVEFTENESEAVRYDFEETNMVTIDHNGIHCTENTKSEVLLKVMGIVGQLVSKGFYNLSIVEIHIYREETDKVFEIENHGDSAISIKQDKQVNSP